MAEVKAMIIEWRTLTEQCTSIKSLAAETDKKVRQQIEEHRTSVMAWTDQKAKLNKNIEDLSTVNDTETAAAEAAAAEVAKLERDADEQQHRNEDHRIKLSSHLEKLHTEAAKIETRDAVTAQQLLSFRRERELRRMQLVQALETVRAIGPAEEAEGSKKIADAAERKEIAQRQLEMEKKRYAKMVADRKVARYNEICDAVEGESAACKRGRKYALELKSQLEEGIPDNQGIVNLLHSIRTSLVAHLRPIQQQQSNNFDMSSRGVSAEPVPPVYV